MNSLKKKDLKSKFGKFAVSAEKMAKVKGGYIMADCDGELAAAATYEELYELVYSNNFTNCILIG